MANHFGVLGGFVPDRMAAPMSVHGVRRAKAALSSGGKPHPATAPAGSNRSSHGGNEVAEDTHDRSPGQPARHSAGLTPYSPNAKDNFEFELKICGWRGDAVLDLRRK